MAFWVGVQPVRGAVYVYERYDLANWFVDATFTDDRRLGIYPVASYDTVYGVEIGARALYKDILGSGERLKLRGDYGGQFKYAVGAGLTTGHRFGRIRFDADTSLERRPRDPFYGIGNGDELPLPTDTPPSMPLDPTLESSVVSSRFQQDVLRTVVGAKLRITDKVATRLSWAWMKREFDSSMDKSIEERFDTSMLVGWDTGVNTIYVDSEIAYDSRRPSTPFATQTLDSAGWLARGYGGIARGVNEDPTNYYAYGGELQRHFDLYEGTRMLALRVGFDALGNSDGRTDGNISFVDLPRLGGPEYLRGYPIGRFRDRIVTLGTAEYTWAIMNNSAAYLFADIGKPFAYWADASDGPLRFGYGIGLQIHTKNTFLMRTQLAFSRDGDIGVNLVFSPVFGRRERIGRF